jgi:hypothetical protein
MMSYTVKPHECHPSSITNSDVSAGLAENWNCFLFYSHSADWWVYPIKETNINGLLTCTGILFFADTHTHFFFHQHWTPPLSSCSPDITNSDYTVHTCICAVLNFLAVTSLVTLFILKRECVLHVSYSKCAENTFITEVSIILPNSKN